MLKFITHKRLESVASKPSWLVVHRRDCGNVKEHGFTDVILSDTKILIHSSTTIFTDEADKADFIFELAQYLVEKKELIMGEDGDYYLPEEE